MWGNRYFSSLCLSTLRGKIRWFVLKLETPFKRRRTPSKFTINFSAFAGGKLGLFDSSLVSMSSSCCLFRFLFTGTALKGSSSVASPVIFSLDSSAILFPHVCVAIVRNGTISFPGLLTEIHSFPQLTRGKRWELETLDEEQIHPINSVNRTKLSYST